MRKIFRAQVGRLDMTERLTCTLVLNAFAF